VHVHFKIFIDDKAMLTARCISPMRSASTSSPMSALSAQGAAHGVKQPTTNSRGRHDRGGFCDIK